MTQQHLLIGGALITGLLLGVAYFGSLWLTVKRLPHLKRPKRVMFGSLAVRLLVALAVFYGMVQLGLWTLGACFVGFLIGRKIMVGRLGRPAMPEYSASEAGAHENRTG